MKYNQYPQGNYAEWLKAFSKFLRYRPHATEDIKSEYCKQIIKTALDLFERQLPEGGTFTFRWSAVTVVFLLRRRIFDSSFMEPDSALGKRAKGLFRKAIDLYDDGRGPLHPIEGAVDVPEALQQMIDYIDKRGTGVPEWARENQ